MSPFVSTVTQILSILTLAGGIIFVVLLAALLIGAWNKNNAFAKQFLNFFKNNAILLSFIVAGIATAGSLFYSDVAGFEPCRLCWFQRIFMYPQVLLLGMALWKQDSRIVDYSFALSAIGGFIATYHYYLQVSGSTSFSCSTIGYSVACSQRFILHFGYITIPMMAITAFALIALIMVIKKFSSKNS